MQNNNRQIVIIGGGMVGMACAIALAKEYFEVTVIDHEMPMRQLQPEFDGRVSAINWGNYKFLDSIGVWQHLAEYAEAITDIRVSEFGSSLFTHFDHEEIAKPNEKAEPFGYIVENRHTRYALQQAAKRYKNLKIIAPAKLLKIEDGKLIIQTKDNQSSIINYQLIIGADGKNSQVRQLAGIECKKRDYKQTAIVCTIAHELPHMGLAHEHFLNAGPFAVLPLSNNRSSLVWTEHANLAPLYIKMPEDEFNTEIAKRIKHLGAVKALPGRWSYPLSLSHAKQYIKGNVALIGDAAHSIHPIAGQGVNLGFRDAKLLAEKLAECAELGLNYENALETYAKQRRLDNKLMIFATDMINRLFSNNIFPLKIARDLGLGAVNEIAPLRKFFMRYASGKI